LSQPCLLRASGIRFSHSRASDYRHNREKAENFNSRCTDQEREKSWSREDPEPFLDKPKMFNNQASVQCQALLTSEVSQIEPNQTQRKSQTFWNSSPTGSHQSTRSYNIFQTTGLFRTPPNHEFGELYCANLLC
jgi:hypothetical protein